MENENNKYVIEARDCKNRDLGKDLEINRNTSHIILKVCDIVSEECDKNECFSLQDNMDVNGVFCCLSEDLVIDEHGDNICPDGQIVQLDTLIQNCKDLFISENSHDHKNPNKQTAASEIDRLESENKILFDDEIEDCVLEHKAIDDTFFCDNPTSLPSQIDVKNINSNESELITVYENIGKSILSDDIEEGKTEYSYSKDKTLVDKIKFTELDIPNENEIIMKDIHIVSKSINVSGSSSENTKSNEKDKQEFSCNLEKNKNHSEDTVEGAKLYLEHDDTNKMETYPNESSNNDAKNYISKQTEQNESGSTRVSVVEEESETDIHEAIRSNDESLVRQLLAKGVDPNEPDWKGTGDPPIVLAALKQNISIVKVLCEGGCDINMTSVRGETALHMAVSRRPVNLQLLDTLLTVGCDTNVQDKLRGCSALHCVSGFADDEPKVFRRLVAVTDINLRDHRQCTVLHRVAATSNNVMWINQLLKLGADPSLQNDRGETALCVALERGWEEGALALVAGGTDVNRTNLYHETAMHVAARHNQANVVAALLGIGADVNAQDLAGNTALHLAAGRGYVDTVRQLISCPHLDLDTHNADGATPLTCAVESGFISVVQMLVQAEQVDLQPALDAAKQGYRRLSQPEMCQLLTQEMARRQTPQID